MTIPAEVAYDVFISHSHSDAEWVSQLAQQLEGKKSFQVWLDKWVLIPGQSWQRAMAQGIKNAKSCAVCLNGNTPAGWFQQEIERALEIQASNSNYRVIPVLLPNAPHDFDMEFLSLRTWADFREGKDQDYAFHVLTQGIKGVPIGKWPLEVSEITDLATYENRLRELQRFRTIGVHEEVVIEFEKKVLAKWFEEKAK